MNLYPLESTDPAAPLAPADWTMDVGTDAKGDNYYFADVKRRGKHVCRLSLAGTVSSEDEARRLLATKARIWIHDYLSRPVSGD